MKSLLGSPIWRNHSNGRVILLSCRQFLDAVSLYDVCRRRWPFAESQFTKLLESRRRNLDTFPAMLRSLWVAMDRGDFSPILEMKLLRFNGKLFAESEALPVTEAQLELLIDAAKSDWRAVEPAIFGTLLERRSTPSSGTNSGPIHTESLRRSGSCSPTIVEPLREEWESVQAAAITHAKTNDLDKAKEEVRSFLTGFATSSCLTLHAAAATFFTSLWNT